MTVERWTDEMLDKLLETVTKAAETADKALETAIITLI